MKIKYTLNNDLIVKVAIQIMIIVKEILLRLLESEWLCNDLVLENGLTSGGECL